MFQTKGTAGNANLPHQGRNFVVLATMLWLLGGLFTLGQPFPPATNGNQDAGWVQQAILEAYTDLGMEGVIEMERLLRLQPGQGLELLLANIIVPCDTNAPAPTILAVSADCGSDQILITFSKQMNVAIGNTNTYRITPGVSVISAIPGSFSGSVTLNVTGLTDTNTYMLFITNLADSCDIRLPANASPVVFSCRPCNSVPPAVTSITASCASGQVRIAFSKPMNRLIAQDPANYAIVGIPVLSAILDITGSNVTLKVAGLASDLLYTISISNLQDECDHDLAPNPTSLTFACQSVAVADLMGLWPGSMRQSCAFTARLKPYLILKGPFVVTNAGTAAVSSTVVKFYLTTDDVVDGSAILLQTTACRSLNPHQARRINFQGKLPVCTVASNKFVIAVVNANLRAKEGDTNNNQRISERLR